MNMYIYIAIYRLYVNGGWKKMYVNIHSIRRVADKSSVCARFYLAICIHMGPMKKDT